MDNAQKKSFQIHVNRRIESDPNTGRDNGRMIRHRICRSLAPSILAASMKDVGIVLKNPRNINMENGN
jgi:hypothetical protein